MNHYCNPEESEKSSDVIKESMQTNCPLKPKMTFIAYAVMIYFLTGSKALTTQSLLLARNPSLITREFQYQRVVVWITLRGLNH